jgi:hypothetical protein
MRTQITFRWKNSQGEQSTGKGSTRDVSVIGVYALAASCPPVNTPLSVEIILRHLNDVSSTRIKAAMKVVRVEHDFAGEEQSGFAAVGKRFGISTVSKQEQITDPAGRFEEQP